MNETWTLAKRELHAYFNSPAAYVVLSVFLLFTGWFFGNALFLENVASLRSVFDIAPFIFLFFIPAITMSLFSEERRAGPLDQCPRSGRRGPGRGDDGYPDRDTCNTSSGSGETQFQSPADPQVLAAAPGRDGQYLRSGPCRGKS